MYVYERYALIMHLVQARGVLVGMREMGRTLMEVHMQPTPTAVHQSAVESNRRLP